MTNLIKGQLQEHVPGNIVSPAPATPWLQAIQQWMAGQMSEVRPDFTTDVIPSIPEQTRGLYSIVNIGYIEPSLDSPDRLRIRITQLAYKIAGEVKRVAFIQPVDRSIGFIIERTPAGEPSLPGFARAVLSLLQAFSTAHPQSPVAVALPNPITLAVTMGLLLRNNKKDPRAQILRLSDNGLAKLFRLLRLARRMWEWVLVATVKTHHATVKRG
jgi:hypothetical protein